MQSINGFMLLEVLLSFFVFSLGIFTVSHLYLQALHYERQAYHLNVANLQALSLMEQLQGRYCDSENDIHLEAWQARNQQLLPRGTGDLIRQAEQCYVSIAWFDPKGHRCPTGHPQDYSCIQLLIGSS